MGRFQECCALARRYARLFAPAIEGADHMQPQGVLSNAPPQDFSSVISSASRTSAAPWRMTRQRMSWLDRIGFGSLRAMPSNPANSTPSVASISSATQTIRKVFTGLM